MTSVDEALETGLGVDPNDPEEIARKKFYKENMDAFQHIIDINQRKKRKKFVRFCLLVSNY